MDIQKENTKYLASLLANCGATQDEINDLSFDDEAGFFESNRLADWFVSQINFGWRVWQASKASVPEGFVLVKVSDRDQEMLELIDQRDHMESQAEELKDKLQALYGVDFGEHSSCNFPFQNAIDYDDSDLVLVPKEPTKDTLIEIASVCIGDDFANLDEAKELYKAAIKAQEQK